MKRVRPRALFLTEQLPGAHGEGELEPGQVYRYTPDGLGGNWDTTTGLPRSDSPGVRPSSVFVEPADPQNPDPLGDAGRARALGFYGNWP